MSVADLTRKHEKTSIRIFISTTGIGEGNSYPDGASTTDVLHSSLTFGNVCDSLDLDDSQYPEISGVTSTSTLTNGVEQFLRQGAALPAPLNNRKWNCADPARQSPWSREAAGSAQVGTVCELGGPGHETQCLTSGLTPRITVYPWTRRSALFRWTPAHTHSHHYLSKTPYVCSPLHLFHKNGVSAATMTPSPILCLEAVRRTNFLRSLPQTNSLP
ncbi:hypothetical protein C8J57DRAFT_1255228 [Mycena rebaudengoi]|nr:hypothetical protein C8J57DRAFT_1255228 [Mycena rebaudengoi]